MGHPLSVHFLEAYDSAIEIFDIKKNVGGSHASSRVYRVCIWQAHSQNEPVEISECVRPSMNESNEEESEYAFIVNTSGRKLPQPDTGTHDSLLNLTQISAFADFVRFPSIFTI